MTTFIKEHKWVNNHGQPPSKRRRINAACLTCRKRKTRCAGERPVCSTCAKNGHTCLGYNDLDEKKRPGNGGPADAHDFRDDTKHEPEDDYVNVENVENVEVKVEPQNMWHNHAEENYANDGNNKADQRFWKSRSQSQSQPQPKPRMAGFVDPDALSRQDSVSTTTVASGRRRKHSNDWDQDDNSQNSNNRSSNNRSPVQQQHESHRVPYFRYFGPTAIVPGFKQMVVDISREIHRDRRKSRGSSFSTTSPGSLYGYGVGQHHYSNPGTELETLEDTPVYDVNDPNPVHPLILNLAITFFTHLGCNYQFMRRDKTLRMLKEKRLEPILVDAMCALAARFSDEPIFINPHDGKEKRSEFGQVFARRAKAATVDTFPCPSVAAVQACLLMAYEGFGSNQDSALWMYLGLAIRMAVDLGLQKLEGVKYQGERDPWYTRSWSRKSNDGSDEPEGKQNDEEALGPQEQREVEQERIDTFWTVFVLDRVISSGTGRPVTFRDDDFELSLPEHAIDPVSGWPDPFPPFIEIIHLYGRVSDVLNNIRNANDLTEEKMQKLAQMEIDLSHIYKKQDSRLHFDAANFRKYVEAGKGTTFILLHFWFHALIIVLHQPTLLTPFYSLRPTQLLPNSRELSMSSAKTIADILAFAELIDPKSFIGNPFTSQPMYIAACAFLMESGANASHPPSREPSPSPEAKTRFFKGIPGKFGEAIDPRHVKHSLLVSAASKNYTRCYKSLQQLQQYWAGVGYILNALDQKSKGIWDCETFNHEDAEAIKLARRGSLGRLPRFEHPASPNVPPIAYSLTGTTNSPNSNLTVLFQNPTAQTSLPPIPPPPPPSVPVSAATPPGNMTYDPVRQSLPDTPSAMLPPAYPQANISALRYQSRTPKLPKMTQSPAMGKSLLKYESSPSVDLDLQTPPPPDQHSRHSHLMHNNNNHNHQMSSSYASSSSSHHHHSTNSSYETSTTHEGSSSTTPTDSSLHQYHNSHNSHSHHHHHHHHDNSHNNNNNNSSSNNNSHNHHNHQDDNDNDGVSNNHNDYETDFSHSGFVSGSYSYLAINPISEGITSNSFEVNFDMLGLQSEMMPPWLEILPGEVLGGLFEGGLMHQGHHHGHHHM
ncbi:fungal-specific transcription factor domain-containing protein [Apiosordaria backusii]|uniref:Fungal-specific transcription factor domain-containing protein n=1 Tax=Apiosordaria backusii TaxID=314023 RepID=A0AA40EXR7_9PEZI|nr:fungal-specific transcription factor domain-containing protein [Apiosordaria backusii]